MKVIRKPSKKKEVRFVYILRVDNMGRRSRFFGLNEIYYVGQTNNIKRRIVEHLNGINSPFLRMNFRDARKILVYVSYVDGNEYDALGEETRIRNMSKSKKEKLIDDEFYNKLVVYKPCKAIILRKYEKEDEQVAIRLR